MPTNSAHDDTLPWKGKKQCKHPMSMAKKTGVFSSPGELVFQNDLLLSEIYKHLDTKGDQKTCLLVSKSGYDTAAKRLYREMRIEDLAPFFAGNCSIERLNFLAHNVRILQIPYTAIEHEPSGRILLDKNCPAERYPNLTLLEIGPKKRGSPIARVVGRYRKGRRVLDIAFDVYSLEQVNWEGPILHVPEYEPECLLYLTVLREASSLSDEPNMPGVIMESLIRECLQLLQAECATAWVSGMRSLTHASSVGLLLKDLTPIIQHCGSLTSLSVGRAGGDQRIPEYLSYPEEPTSLKSIDIMGGTFRELFYLARGHRDINFTCSGNITKRSINHMLDCIRDWESVRRSQTPSKLNLRLGMTCVEINPYLVAKFLHGITANRTRNDLTVINIEAWGLVGKPEQLWLDHVRCTLADLRKEARRMNGSGRPGWRRIK